jgi:hypothetical protein
MDTGCSASHVQRRYKYSFIVKFKTIRIKNKHQESTIKNPGIESSIQNPVQDPAIDFVKNQL